MELSPSQANDWLDIASRLAGVSGDVLLVILVALLLIGQLVPGIYYREMRSQRDEWRKQAERGGAVGRSGTELAQESTSLSREVARMMTQVISQAATKAEKTDEPQRPGTDS